MLLFIWLEILLLGRRKAGFNTSHVTLYLEQGQMEGSAEQSFNTSHVTLYPGKPQATAAIHVVSIHLMLLFIESVNSFQDFESSFNTSHVTLYRLASCRKRSQKPVSIHLMLLFIVMQGDVDGITVSVSIHLMLLFIQCGEHNDSPESSFQYISCYSLSRDSKRTGYRNSCVSIHLMLLFIDIENGKNN